MSANAADIAVRNRQNSLSSTGPKTVEGKTVSSRNATKHGITSHSLVVADEDPDRAGAMIAACEQELALAGEFGKELARGLVLNLRREERLVRHEDALIAKARAEAEDESRYEETSELAELREHLAVSQQVHAIVSGAEFLSSEPTIAETQTFLDWIAKVVAGCPIGNGGIHPASNLVVKLQDELKRLLCDGGDTKHVLVGLGKVTKAHCDFVLQKMVAVEKQRRGKIDRAKRLAEIPTEADLKRLARYRRMIDQSMLDRLEAARRLRDLLQPSD